jgi:hypothetical protein
MGCHRTRLCQHGMRTMVRGRHGQVVGLACAWLIEQQYWLVCWMTKWNDWIAGRLDE